MKLKLALAALAACAGALIAATLPSAGPVHSGLSQGQLLGYIADSTQQSATGSGVATMPVAGPVHSGLSQGQLLGYIADYTQDSAGMLAGRLFYASSYGATAGDATDDRAALQAAIDACSSAGGGIVALGIGTYYVVPLADPVLVGVGTGLFLRTGVTLQGCGASSVISGKTAGNTTGFCLVAPYDSNTTSTAFGAHEIRIRDLQLQTDDATHIYTHSLLGLNHCPSALVEKVTFKDSYYHGVEIDRSRNITLRDCRFTGDFYSSQIQIDTGASGAISTSGAATANYVNENILIERCLFGARTTSTAATPGRTAIELCHNASQINRNIRITGNTIYCHTENVAGMTGSTTRIGIGNDSTSYASMTGLEITGNQFYSDNATGNMIAIFLSHTSTKTVKGVNISGNTFYGSYLSLFHFQSAGQANSAALGAGVTDGAYVSGVNFSDNSAILTVGAPTAAGAVARGMRLVNITQVGDAVVSRNNITLSATEEASWATSGSTVNSFNYFCFLNHVRDLRCENNRFHTDSTRNWSWYALCFADSGFNANSIPANAIITGNHVSAYTAGTLIYTSYYYASTILRSAWVNPTTCRGEWRDNKTTNVSAGKSGTFWTTNDGFTYGIPDYRPGWERIGEKKKFASAPGGGWRSLAGTAYASLNPEEQHAWNYTLGQGATALPTETNIYIRLSGSETNITTLETSPP